MARLSTGTAISFYYFFRAEHCYEYADRSVATIISHCNSLPEHLSIVNVIPRVLWEPDKER